MLSSFRFVMWGQLSLTPWGQIRKTRSKSSERCTQWLWIQDADMEGLGCGHDLWQIAVPDTGTGTEDSTFGWIDQDAGFLRFFGITVIRRWYALFAGSASECSITGLPVLGAKLDERVWTCKIQSPYSDITVEKEISKQAEVHVELNICKPRMSTSETFGASRRWKRCYLQLEVMMSTFQSQWVAAGAMLSWCWGSY